MKKENKPFIIVPLFIIGLTLLLFGNFFFKGLTPFPGNYMLAWYEPWKSDHIVNQTITIVHKAVADDTFRQFLPFRLLAADMLKNLQLPLWNPYNGSGMPLLATMHSGLLNPFSLFFVIFPPAFAWSFHIITQLILLCLFTYLYCRSLGMKLVSSLFTITILSLSGFVTVRLVFGDYIYTLAGLPLVLYLIESIVKQPKSKKIFFITPGILFILLSGAPQIILYVLLIIIIYTIIRVKNLKVLLLFLLQFILGFGLAALQLLPTLELYHNASITTNSSSFIFNRFLLPFSHLITIIIPNYFGNQGIYNYWGSGDYIETITAIGSIPCFLAFFYLFIKDEKRKVIKQFYLFAFCLSIISTLNWAGSRFLFTLPIPILSTGIPSRIFIISTFSISILAGLGFDKLVTEKYSLRTILLKIFPYLLIMVIITISSLLLFYLNTPCPTHIADIQCYKVALRNTVIEDIIFFIFITLFVISFIKNKTLTKTIQIMLFVLILTGGIYNANKFLPFSNKETFTPKNELINYLQKYTLDGRVFGFDEANIKTDFATLFHFYDPDYYDPLYIKRYGELVAYAKNGNVLRSDVEIDQSKNIPQELQAKRTRLLTLLSVKYLIYKQTKSADSKPVHPIWQNNEWYVEKNNLALPRFFLVNNYFVLASDNKTLETLFSPTFNPQTTVLLQKELPRPINKTNNSKGTVKLQAYGENSVTITSSTDSDQLLVLTDNYYPGWKAYVDNKNTEVYRANYTFRAVVVPRGDHIVTFSYQPYSLQFGLLISITSLIIYFLSSWIVLYIFSHKSALFNQ